MSVLIFVDHSEGHISKSSFEALSYGFALAKQTNTTADAVVLGDVSDDEAASLGKYGISKTFVFPGDIYNHVDAQVYTKAIAEAMSKSEASVIIFSHNQTGRAVAPRVAAKLKAGLVTGVAGLPKTDAGFVVRKTVFSGKAFANVDITSPVKAITVTPNNFSIKDTGDNKAEVVTINMAAEPKVKTTATNKVSGEVPLTEAEIVVSGGRGL
jgi:electron transfer flavoprotein alpha subunit